MVNNMQTINEFPEYSITSEGLVTNISTGRKLKVWIRPARGLKSKAENYVTLRKEGKQYNRSVSSLLLAHFPEYRDSKEKEAIAARDYLFTQESLRRNFTYNEDTGEFLPIDPAKGKGYISRTGYWITDLGGKHNKTHRLIWIYMTGKEPEGYIDHINHIKTDNRWCNLRDVTKQDNEKNLGKSPKNTSGITGVYWHKQCQKWRACIQVDGKQVALGLYASKEEAAQVRKAAEKLQGYHENHGTNCPSSYGDCH